MTPEAERLVRESAPSVWLNKNFYCEDGWSQILIELGPKLAELEAVIGGVKEKYARMEFHVASPNPPYGNSLIEGLLKAATLKSEETCEICGNPGRWVMNPNMWERTVCAVHQKEDEESWV